MSTLHHWLVAAHIIFGSLALVLFWVPAIAKKGSRLHVRGGRLYTNLMYAVCATAFVASVLVLVGPLAVRRPGEVLEALEADRLAAMFRMYGVFLLTLSVLVFASLRHGIAALRARTRNAALSTPVHRMTLAVLGLLGATVIIVGIVNLQILLMVFGGISLAGSIRMLRETRIERPSRRELVVAHLNGLIGSGIGAYTAFFAFGGSRFLADVLPGQWQIVPWVMPAIIGSIVIALLKRRYVGTPSAAQSA